MIWVTSDTHFNHQNIIRFCLNSRPFDSVEEMNKTIVERWNSVVSPNDEVIHCGDFFMGKTTDIAPILSQLNGKITLIRGNHDSKPRIEVFQSFGIEVKDIDYLSYKGRYFIFCHFPILNEAFAEMVRKDNSEVIFCYGHIHDNAPAGLVDGSFHVGVDTNNLTPVSIKHIWQLSREEEEQRKVPPVKDSICETCASYLCQFETCKGQDGGCPNFKEKEGKF